MTALLWIVLIAAALVGLWFAAHARSRRNPVAFAPWMTPILELPWRNREVTIERAGIAAGERLLEVGPGAGFLTEKALERVGADGRVVCLDLQIEMLRKVRARLGDAPALVCASGSQLPFRDGAFDRVFLAHVLGEIPDKAGACAELHRVVRSGGEAAFEEGIPDPDYISKGRLEAMTGDAGFTPGPRTGHWANYTWRFTRP